VRNRQLPVGAPLRDRLESIGRSGEDIRLPKYIKRNALLVSSEANLVEGNASEALALVDPIIQELRREEVSDPRLLAWAQTVRGLALQAKNRDVEALESFAEAHRQNISRFGPSHPLTILYALHQSKSLVRTGHEDVAVRMLDAAIPVLRTAMGDPSPLVERVTRLKAQISGPARSLASQPNDPVDFFM
jgi:hypothetical protein